MGLLSLDSCTIKFGGLTAVENLTIDIAGNDLAGLIGPNGAGKTTVFNMITGVYRPTSGNIAFNTRRIVGLKPHEIAKLGIARTFQNIRLFPSLTVYETVQAAFNKNIEYGFMQAVGRVGSYQREENKIASNVMEILEIFSLTDVKDEIAVSLPYGSQRRVEIVRALATRPKLLLLDEPAAGMNSSEKIALVKLIKSIKDRFDISILIIEHDMRVIMNICERIMVLNYGIMIAQGTPLEIRNNPSVIEAYLGEQV
ncbi:MAG: high-affinity branched-chain amino acid ABC transporter ATP-binding protein LivG [candidate division Zixibacteria bacterium CG_4_9_14_3_um_filter_46_8]|nr:MAG: high-affinity branched-chain amino acid ABC transporter ATP-binding protein LivG [candidate division Zixibacteria bacterium CG_4_9_14_3_um_filter_46_8]